MYGGGSGSRGGNSGGSNRYCHHQKPQMISQFPDPMQSGHPPPPPHYYYYYHHHNYSYENYYNMYPSSSRPTAVNYYHNSWKPNPNPNLQLGRLYSSYYANPNQFSGRNRGSNFTHMNRSCTMPGRRVSIKRKRGAADSSSRVLKKNMNNNIKRSRRLLCKTLWHPQKRKRGAADSWSVLRKNMNNNIKKSRRFMLCTTTLGHPQKRKRVVVVMDPSESCPRRDVQANTTLSALQTSANIPINNINIPDSLMFFEILARLPVESILRFRCVCKLWNSLTQEKQFIDRHMELSIIRCNNSATTNLMNTIILSNSQKNRQFLHYFGDNDHVSFNILSRFKERNYEMSNSCNGLVCIYRKRIHLVNPSMNEFVTLPSGASCNNFKGDTHGVALVYDDSVHKYKVVRLFTHGSKVGCQILILGSSSETWKDVGDIPEDTISYYSTVVADGGRTIYLASYDMDSSDPQSFISFDIQSESFNVVMPRPPTPPAGFLNLSADTNMYQAEVGGCYCLYYHLELTKHRDKYLHMWILQEDAGNKHKKIWTEHRIDLDLMEGLSDLSSHSVCPQSMHDGNILLTDTYGRFDWYDLKTGIFFGKPFYLTGGAALPYFETLVSPLEITRRSN